MTKKITIHTRTQWRQWLKKNHRSEEKVFLVSYKKHTGKKFLTHRTQLEEAICFGWIDTTVKRIDEDRDGRYFVRRKENATWSKNTLSYGEKLLKEGRMSALGKKMFLLGKKKKPIDQKIPKTFKVPPDLRDALKNNLKAQKVFNVYSPSVKKVHLKWLFSAKRPETRKNRIKKIIAVSYTHLTLPTSG